MTLQWTCSVWEGTAPTDSIWGELLGDKGRRTHSWELETLTTIFMGMSDSVAMASLAASLFDHSISSLVSCFIHLQNENTNSTQLTDRVAPAHGVCSQSVSFCDHSSLGGSYLMQKHSQWFLCIAFHFACAKKM